MATVGDSGDVDASVARQGIQGELPIFGGLPTSSGPSDARASTSIPTSRGPAESRSMVRLLSGDFLGIQGRCVEVQVDVAARGCPGFDIVGLAGKSIRESRERIRAAFRNSGLRFPTNHRILVNLAPAAEEKDGAGFDLPIALGILIASGQVALPDGVNLARAGFLGELGLDGKILPVPGALLAADALFRGGATSMVVALGNAGEAALVRGISVFAAGDLHAALAALGGRIPPHSGPAEHASGGDGSANRGAPRHGNAVAEPGNSPGRTSHPAHSPALDFAEVRGQDAAKRALLVAAAGGHNILMTGPPGVGKTMLARRLPGILPPLEFSEAMEVTRILSVLGHSTGDRLVEERPFRAPHHTISYAGLVGGGAHVHPGEVTRAHRGVLFLDELPEFPRRALEALREPTEEGVITITRGSGSRTFPARFLLVAAMNPCPCGYLGHRKHGCACTPLQLRSYRQRVSGPLLDRMDIFVEVGAVRADDLLTAPSGPLGERSSMLRERVLVARAAQAKRWGGSDTNSGVSLSRLLAEGSFRDRAIEGLRGAAERWGISARGFASCLRVSRTIADIEGERWVDSRHLGEALHFRHPPR